MCCSGVSDWPWKKTTPRSNSVSRISPTASAPSGAARSIPSIVTPTALPTGSTRMELLRMAVPPGFLAARVPAAGVPPQAMVSVGLDVGAAHHLGPALDFGGDEGGGLGRGAAEHPGSLGGEAGRRLRLRQGLAQRRRQHRHAV